MTFELRAGRKCDLGRGGMFQTEEGIMGQSRSWGVLGVCGGGAGERGPGGLKGPLRASHPDMLGTQVCLRHEAFRTNSGSVRRI